MLKSTCLLMLFALLCISSFCQEAISYKHYNEDSGIFNEKIFNITSDEKGVIYFNSTTGTEYFNGTKFGKLKDVEKNIFNKFPKLNYSSSKLIFNTMNEVYLYDGNNFQLLFSNKEKYPISNLKLSKNNFFAVYNINSSIYIRCIFNPKLYITLHPFNDVDIKIRNLMLVNNGEILVSTNKGLFSINHKTIINISESNSYNSFKDKRNQTIYNITDNSVEVFDNEYKLKNKIEFRNNLFDKLNIDKTNLIVYSYLVNNHIYIFSPLLNHKKLESLDSSCTQFINNSKNIFDISINYKQSNINHIEVPNEIINPTFFFANTNTELWISSLNGLYKINIKQILPKIHFIKTAFPINNILKSNNSILSADNFLTINEINDSGLYHSNSTYSSIKNTLHVDFSESSYCMYFGKNKNLYIGTIQDGVIRIDSNQQIHYLTSNLDPFEKVCMTITGDKKGNVYASGYNKILKIDSNQAITFIQHPQLSKKFIYKLQTIDDKIFIFTDNNISILENDSIYDFSSQLNIFNTNFSSIEKIHEDFIITSFTNGVYIVRKNHKNEWQVKYHLNIKNGLISNEYVNAKVDQQNKIWLLSPHSIEILQASNNIYKIISLKNNIFLKNQYYPESSMYIDSNDMLYFGGKHGITIFDTKKIRLDSTNNSFVQITNIYINEEKYISKPNNIKVALNEVALEPSFKYSENNIKFEFGAVDFSDDKIIYQYYLEGLEKDWSSTTKENLINYRNLTPNHYIFHIRYSVNGNWSNSTNYPFVILNPWWKTMWAYGLYLLLAFVGFYCLIKLKTIELSRKQHEILAQIEQKNKILNLQSAALLNQLKPHFIFNALAPLQHYLYTSNKEKGIKYLNTFSNVLRTMLKHSREEFVNLNDEIEFINQYLLQQKIEKDESFDFFIINKVPTNLKLPSLMIQPIIENIIQHGLADNNKGELTIIFEQTLDSYIQIKFIENGKGFDLKDQISNSSHRALNIISDRINLYKEQPTYEKVSIHSYHENNGFIIILILPYHEN